MASLVRVDRLSMTGVSYGSLFYTYIFKPFGVSNQKVSGVSVQVFRLRRTSGLKSGQFDRTGN